MRKITALNFVAKVLTFSLLKDQKSVSDLWYRHKRSQATTANIHKQVHSIAMEKLINYQNSNN